MTATYTESVETVVGGGPQVAPPPLAEPPLADALRSPSRLRNTIEEEIDEKQWGRPQAPELTGGTHITVSSGMIDCTLVGGTHITIDGENINHDSPGEVFEALGNCFYVDALGHVILP